MRHVSFFLCVRLSSPSKESQPTPHGHASHHPLNVTTHNQLLNQSTHTHQREISLEREGEPIASTPSNPQPQHTTQSTTQPTTQSHRINPNPQINLAPTYQSTPWNQPNIYKSTQHPQINLHHEINPHSQPANLDQLSKTQPHLERLVSSVALAMKATLREHVYDTFVSIYLIGVTLIK